jgi:hypothetical protein
VASTRPAPLVTAMLPSLLKGALMTVGVLADAVA